MKAQTKVLPVVKGDPSQLKIIAKDTRNETIYMQYTLPDYGTIPVFKLKTFAPGNEDQSLSVLAALLADAAKNQFETVLIDMSKNGGGIICLSDLLLASFNPEWAGLNLTNPSVAYGVYDFRRNDITDLIMGNCAYFIHFVLFFLSFFDLHCPSCTPPPPYLLQLLHRILLLNLQCM